MPAVNPVRAWCSQPNLAVRAAGVVCRTWALALFLLLFSVQVLQAEPVLIPLPDTPKPQAPGPDASSDSVTHVRSDAEPSPQANCLQHQNAIAQAAAHHKVDALLLHALIAQSSSYQPHYQSADGALGLMRVQAAQAQRLGLTQPEALFDSTANLRVGTSTLAALQSLYGGDVLRMLRHYYTGNPPQASQALAPGERPAAAAEALRFERAVLVHYLALRTRSAEAHAGPCSLQGGASP